MQITVTEVPATLKDLLAASWYLVDEIYDGIKTAMITNLALDCSGVPTPNDTIFFEAGNAKKYIWLDALGAEIHAPAISVAESTPIVDGTNIAVRTEKLENVWLVTCPGVSVTVYVAIS